MMRELMLAGMDVARLNFSHGSHDDHALVIARLRKVAKSLGRSICIVQDLQGPKIRTGRLKDKAPVTLRSGAKVTITTRDIEGTAELLSTSFKLLPKEVKPGALILLSDGRLSLRVLSVTKQDVVCKVIDGGTLAQNQGINLPGTIVSVPSLTEKDREDLAFGLKQGIDVVAVSFVRTAKDVTDVKKAIADLGYKNPVIAKLEKPQAIDHLEEIFAVTDAVMVARGDLGVETSPEKVPTIQKHIIQRAMEWRKPVITATQMLESMIQNPRPTRAEASDVANAVFDGTDAVMLSGETAAGAHPREAVDMMARIILEAESHPPSTEIRRRSLHRDLSISEAICESVAHVAEALNLKAIAAFTESGATPKLISKYRPRVVVYAFAPVQSVCNRANLFWGVRPLNVEQTSSVESMVQKADVELQRLNAVKAGDVIGIVAGTQKTEGSTNFLRLHRVGQANVSHGRESSNPAHTNRKKRGK